MAGPEYVGAGHGFQQLLGCPVFNSTWDRASGTERVQGTVLSPLGMQRWAEQCLSSGGSQPEGRVALVRSKVR